MPSFKKPDQEIIDNTTEHGGVAEETKRKRAREAKFFDDFLIEHYGGQGLDQLVESLDKEGLIQTLNDAVRGYYQSMLVKNKYKNDNGEEVIEELSPKRNTVECSKSHLKKVVLDAANLDITGPDFAKFNEFWKGFGKNLKKEGRNNTEHRKEISQADYQKILGLLVLLNKIMKAEKGSDEYWALVKQLPPRYQDSYHILIQWGKQFVVMSSTAQRAREGIENLKRSHFEKRYDEDLDEHYYAEIEATFSKNHRNDDEGNRDEKGATIPFRTSENGFNPGEFIENSEEYSCKENPHFFQRPLKKLDIHDPKTKVYFGRQKVGKHLIADMLSQLAFIAGVKKRLVNSQLRPTLIRNWLRHGFSVHEVVQITRQHPSTIEHYDPEASLSKRLEMSSTLLAKNARAPKKSKPSTTASRGPFSDVQHAQKMVFKCQFCHQEKNSREEIQKHELDFHGQYHFQPENCANLLFAAAKELPASTAVNEGQLLQLEVFQCRYCPDIKDTREELEIHELGVHGETGLIQKGNLEILNPVEEIKEPVPIQSLPEPSGGAKCLPNLDVSSTLPFSTVVKAHKMTFKCRFCQEEKKSKEEIQKHEVEFHGKYCFKPDNGTNFAAAKTLPESTPLNEGELVKMEVYKCRYCPDMKTTREEIEKHELGVHGQNGVVQVPKTRLLNLDVFEDDGGIDFNAIEEQSNEMIVSENQVIYNLSVEKTEKRKSNSDNDQKLKKRKPLSEISNEMNILKNPLVAADFFSDWKGEKQRENENYQKIIEQSHIQMSREQYLRAKELQIREKEQEILMKSVEAQNKTQGDLMAMLQRFEQRLHGTKDEN